MLQKHLFSGLSLLVIAALLASGIHPYDRPTWLLEVGPVLLAAPVLVATRRRFPLTALLYILICIHALILILGGAYTYARVPLGFWLQDFFALSRNPYDKIGHFAQGFEPALLAREILLRGRYLSCKPMTAFLSLCVAVAISAFYELLEWAAALAWGDGAYEFLGTQGDAWDTQADIFFALIGASAALLGFTRFHDRQIAALEALDITAPSPAEQVKNSI
jgi:putative membrane protein